MTNSRLFNVKTRELFGWMSRVRKIQLIALTLTLLPISPTALADNVANYQGLAWSGYVYKVTAGYEDGLSYAFRFKEEPGLKALIVSFEHSNGIDSRSANANMQKLSSFPNEEIWKVNVRFPENAPVGIWKGKLLVDLKTNVSINLPLFEIEVLKKPSDGTLTFEQETKLIAYLNLYREKKIPSAQDSLNAITSLIKRAEAYTSRLTEMRSIDEFNSSKQEISNFVTNIQINANDNLKSSAERLEEDRNFWNLNVVGWKSDTLSRASEEYRALVAKYEPLANELINDTRELEGLITATESKLLMVRTEERVKSNSGLEFDSKSKLEVKTKKRTKKSTITCVKGKVVKKFSGISPRCPVGYKKR